MNTKTISLISLVGLIGLAWFFMTKKPTNYNPLEIDTITVGTSGDYPPFSFIQNNQLTGLEIDLVHEIGRRIGKKVVFKDMAFINLIPELQRGKIHLIAAGMTPSPERIKRIDFATPHIIGSPLVIVTKATNQVATLDDLKDKSIVVNEGYTADAYMTSWNKAPLTRLTCPADAFLALKSGRAYAYVDAKPAVLPFFQQYGTQEFTMTPVDGTGESSALGLSKQYPEFKQVIEQTIADMHTDGTIDTLKKKWGIL